MTGRNSLALVLVLAAAALPAQAETFKWVDEKGVINYSDKPPLAGKAAKSLRTVEDRISTYETDPSLIRAMASRGRPDYAEAEWLQRQRLMALRAGYLDCASPYRGDCGYDGYRSSAYYPYVAFPVFRSRPMHRTLVAASFPRSHAERSRSSRGHR